MCCEPEGLEVALERQGCFEELRDFIDDGLFGAVVLELIVSVAVVAQLLARPLFVADELSEHLRVESNPQILLHFDNFLQTDQVGKD